MSLPQKLAVGGAAIGLVLVTLVPWIAHSGAVGFDSTVAITYVMTVAILFTAAVAADNLRAYTESARAQFLPVLEVDIDTRRQDAREFLTIIMRNLGQGHATRVRSVLWMQDDDGAIWLPTLLDQLPRHVPPGDVSEHQTERRDFDLEFARHFRPDLPQAVVEVQYRHALSKDEAEHEVRWFVFELTKGSDGHWTLGASASPVPEDLGSVEGKLQTFREEARLLEREYGLEEQGLRIEVQQDTQVVSLNLMRGDSMIASAQRTLQSPGFDVVEAFRKLLPRALEHLEVEEETRGERGALQ